MPVSDPLAFDLLRAFAQLEFRLKNDPGFLRAGPYRMAQVNWPAVDEAVSRLEDSLFFDRVSDSTHEQILTPPRDRPMVQEVAVVNGLNRAVFQRLPFSNPMPVHWSKPHAACATTSSTGARRSRIWAMMTSGPPPHWTWPSACFTC